MTTQNMKLTSIPFPRLTLKEYSLIALAIGFSVSFILITFQPFGTENFTHEYKNFILLGYGIVVVITICIFYFLSKKVFHKNKEDRWTIVYESIDLFLVLILSLLASYIYSIEVFNGSYDFDRMFVFLMNAFKVAILPVLGCMGYLYFTWKDVVRSSIQPANKDQIEEKGHLKLLLGNSPSDQLEVSSDDILLAQAQSNYVMLFLQQNGKVQRHILRSTLKQINEQLDTSVFMQVHRSYIVNRAKIKNLTGNKSRGRLEIDGLEKLIPVSRNAYDFLKRSV